MPAGLEARSGRGRPQDDVANQRPCSAFRSRVWVSFVAVTHRAGLAPLQYRECADDAPASARRTASSGRSCARADPGAGARWSIGPTWRDVSRETREVTRSTTPSETGEPPGRLWRHQDPALAKPTSPASGATAMLGGMWSALCTGHRHARGRPPRPGDRADVLSRGRATRPGSGRRHVHPASGRRHVRPTPRPGYRHAPRDVASALHRSRHAPGRPTEAGDRARTSGATSGRAVGVSRETSTQPSIHGHPQPSASGHRLGPVRPGSTTQRCGTSSRAGPAGAEASAGSATSLRRDVSPRRLHPSGRTLGPDWLWCPCCPAWPCRPAWPCSPGASVRSAGRR